MATRTHEVSEAVAHGRRACELTQWKNPYALDGLAAACAERDAWDFLFAGPGLKITGSAGSPVSPVAVL